MQGHGGAVPAELPGYRSPLLPASASPDGGCRASAAPDRPAPSRTFAQRGPRAGTGWDPRPGARRSSNRTACDTQKAGQVAFSLVAL